jgi:hypothetical protein
MKMRLFTVALLLGTFAALPAEAGILGLFGKKGKKLPEGNAIIRAMQKRPVGVSHPWVRDAR